jgi:Asp-tRNA(Asn)/Glu-tRNA(Gln) amidotransferase C subunit
MKRAEAQARAQAQGTAEGTQPLRRDVAGADPLRARLSSFAPELVDGFFVVPAVAVPDPARQ